MAQRILLALVAVLAAAWLAVSYRDSRLQERGLELSRLPAEQRDTASVREADDLLRRARFLNPDRTLGYNRALVTLRAGDRDEAIRELERYLREEPENREAWIALWAAALDHEPATARRARRRVTELSGGAEPVAPTGRLPAAPRA